MHGKMKQKGKKEKPHASGGAGNNSRRLERALTVIILFLLPLLSLSFRACCTLERMRFTSLPWINTSAVCGCVCCAAIKHSSREKPLDLDAIFQCYLSTFFFSLFFFRLLRGKLKISCFISPYTRPTHHVFSTLISRWQRSPACGKK